MLGLTVVGLVVLFGCKTRPSTEPSLSVETPRPGPPQAAPPAKPECAQCVLEDLRQAAHREQVTVVARFLGWKGRWLDGKSTRRLCTTEDEVVGVARFELTVASPWPDHPGRAVEAELPCPELSRVGYAKLYHYDPDDTERDGLGHAPRLRVGQRYRVAFVRNAGVTAPRHPANGRFSPILVAIDSL